MNPSSFSKIPYTAIIKEALAPLAVRQKEILERRFGLKGKQKETLESIGQSYGITRERVRQIVNNALAKVKPVILTRTSELSLFEAALKKTGGVRKESALVHELGGAAHAADALFMLTSSGTFVRVQEDNSFHPVWTLKSDYVSSARTLLEAFGKELEKKGEPVDLQDVKLTGEARKTWQTAAKKGYLLDILEISKLIGKSPEGLWGFISWPEVNPKTMRDKAYIAFRKEKKPLHFREVALCIGNSALPQTVHNELIKDHRFVLVGRGMYALKEWGYLGGDVKDVISYVLANAKSPLSKEEIIQQVTKQRFVKESTISFNLNSRKNFSRTPNGKYVMRGEA